MVKSEKKRKKEKCVYHQFNFHFPCLEFTEDGIPFASFHKFLSKVIFPHHSQACFHRRSEIKDTEKMIVKLIYNHCAMLRQGDINVRVHACACTHMQAQPRGFGLSSTAWHLGQAHIHVCVCV